MQFTYKAYKNLIKTLRELDYKFCTYNEIYNCNRGVLLRHDVDFDLGKALEMAIIEKELGVRSTYFILLSTDFYNVFSKESFEKIRKIMNLGHRIGLHFDEQRYLICSVDDIKKNVSYEVKILSELIGETIDAVSMHRPSQLILDSDIKFDGLINSYSSYHFKEIKYISDSRIKWGENVLDVIKKNKYDKFHILVHPFSYDYKNITPKEKLNNFLNQSKIDRYNIIKKNFSNIEEFLVLDEL